MYLALKHAHMFFAIVSGLFFLVRGGWMLMESDKLQQKWVKILPHINDTLLFVCAIALCVILQQYPFVHAWVTVKVLMLLVYIFLGTVAIKRGKTRAIRTLAFFAAVVCFLFIYSVARSHNPWGFLLPLL